MLEGCEDWPEEVAEEYIRHGYWQMLCLHEVLDTTAARSGEKTAVVSGKESLTYHDLQLLSRRLALHFLAQGLKPLDRVLLQLPNIPEFIIVFFALSRIGAIPVMMLPAHRKNELVGIGRLTGARAYIIPSTFRNQDYLSLAAEVKEEVPSLEFVYVAGEEAGDGVSLGKLMGEPLEESKGWEMLEACRPNPREPALFQLSGGTTGLPKVIPRTHNDYLHNAMLNINSLEIHEDAVFLISTPIAHNAPMSCGVLPTISQGGRLVLLALPSQDEILRLLEEEGVTATFAVPAQLASWLQAPGLIKSTMQTLKTLSMGGARLDPALARKFWEKTGVAPMNCFGMAEGGSFQPLMSGPEEERFASIGRPLSEGDAVRLVNENGEDVPPGAVGEMLIKGPRTFRGYYKAPELNALAFTRDGFYRSGDLMRINENGNYVVEGRKKELINRGGEKISPEEVESLLLRHPGVVYAAIVPMPDAILGEKACAFLVVSPGVALTLKEIQEFLDAAGLAKFKWPERLEIIKNLPLSASNKVDKRYLGNLLAENLKKEAGC